MLLVAFLYMIIASTFTLGKLALQYMNPIFFIGVRMIVGGILLLAYLYFFRRSYLKFEKKYILDFIAIILFHIFFAFVSEFWALQRLSSSKVCLFYNLSPFITAIFSFFWFSERMTIKKIIGLLIGFFGFLPIVVFGNGLDNISNVIWFFSWPELSMLFSVICSSFGWILVRKLVNNGYSVLMINGVGMLGGGILSFLTSLFIEGSPSIKSVSDNCTIDLFFALSYAILIILLANVVFYNLYGLLLKRYTATFLSFAGFLTPFFAAFYGWIFIGEQVGLSFFLTILFVFAGLYIFYQEELSQGYVISE